MYSYRQLLSYQDQQLKFLHEFVSTHFVYVCMIKWLQIVFHDIC